MATPNRKRWERVGAHISSTERRAQAAERDAGDRYCAAYLADRVDAEFDGRIAGVTRFGIFVALDETGAEGLVPGATPRRRPPPLRRPPGIRSRSMAACCAWAIR